MPWQTPFQTLFFFHSMNLFQPHNPILPLTQLAIRGPQLSSPCHGRRYCLPFEASITVWARTITVAAEPSVEQGMRYKGQT